MGRSGIVWRTVAALFFIAALNYGDRTAISAVFPLLRADLGLSDMQLGAIGSLFLWSYAFASPLAGQLGDRFPRGRMITWSLLAWSTITFATGLVAHTSQLMGLRVLLGLAESCYIPASVALLADLHTDNRRATVMGIHIAGLNLGLIGGGVLSGFIGEKLGWRYTFFALGGTGLLLAWITSAVLAKASPTVRRPVNASAQDGATLPGRIREILRVRTYIIMIAEAMLISIGTWMFYNWLPLYYQETFHLSLAAAGFSGTFMLQAAAVVGITAGGWISDRFSRGSISRRMLLQAGCYIAAAPFLFTFGMQPSYVRISSSIFLFSLFQSIGSSNENPVVCELLPSRFRASAVGLMNTTNCLAAGAGVFVAGVLKHAYGLGGVFQGIAAFVFTAAALLLFGRNVLLHRDLAGKRSVGSGAMEVRA